ncbi:MAG: hypothetical protein M1814_006401 [Vezdaea aestivalis]|nr:MAG: hypothetical protein M1814_006401 [Vezdaea aestivalis]
MRFRSNIKNILRFTRLAASLGSLGKVAWLRLDNDKVRFTVIPEQGSQVWAVLSIDSIFDADYTIASASPNNAINLELPIQQLHRALKSAVGGSGASIRLTKKNDVPVLCLTITKHRFSDLGANESDDRLPDTDNPHDHETVVTQDIAVKVLALAAVEGLHEPQCHRQPDVHIMLPDLLQIKTISERFVRLAATSTMGSRGTAAPKLELAANMYGGLKLSTATDALTIESAWTGLTNPQLNQEVMGDVENHPSTRMRMRGEESWAKVRIDGRDWAKVLSIGRLNGKHIACITDELALVIYVYLSNDTDGEEDSTLTVVEPI